MTTRSPRINPLLAAVAVLLLVALAVSLAHSETGSPPPERSPQREGGCFEIAIPPKASYNGIGSLLLDRCTGDTWSLMPSEDLIADKLWVPLKRYSHIPGAYRDP